MKQVGKRIVAGVLCAILAVSPLTSCETVTSPEREKEKDVIVIPVDDAIRVESAEAGIPEALRQITVSNDTARKGVIATDSAFCVH